MLTIKVEIREQADGWAYSLDGIELSAQTAPEAFAAVKAHGALLAEAGMPSTTVVTWSPATRIGRMVVRALQ